MSEIVEILGNVPDLTWHGMETSIEEIEDLLKKGVQYKEYKRQMKEGGVLK